MSGGFALLLVDCQQDYLAREGLLPAADRLIPALAAALNAARRAGWPVAHIRTRVAADASDAMPHRRDAPEVIEGTAGAEPPPELAERDSEPVFHKRFFSAFDAAGLDDWLRGTGVERLVLAGVHTHACIQASATDAYARGYAVTIAEDVVGSDRPAAAAQTLDWLEGRAATRASSAAVLGAAAPPLVHRNPMDWDEVLREVMPTPPEDVAAAADRLTGRPPPPLAERCAQVATLHMALSASREDFVAALVRDLGKPRRDAEGEVDYGLALVEAAAAALAEEEETAGGRQVRYRPLGVAGLVTPWNNPFAIPLAKLAPALGYGNAVLWKPAPAGSGIAEMIMATLGQCGLAERTALVQGEAAAGRAVLAAADALSFTGSVPVGRLLVAEAARRMVPVQAELGGSNAAIVHPSADLDAAARDLAAAMFSFAGQRCTAIRRIIVDEAIADSFIERLAEAVGALRVGDPSDPATDVGPVIDRASQMRWLGMTRDGVTVAAAPLLSGLGERGCWVAPTVLDGLDEAHPLLRTEVFGPLAAIVRVSGIDAAIAAHNGTGFGLLGAFYGRDEAAAVRFLAKAEAGMLSLNRARPAFAADGPFVGWKGSAYGLAEHGRWNRDFYTRPQAVYRG